MFQKDSLNAGSSDVSPNEHDSSQKVEWIALLGRRDEPTDGVEDYCACLGKALGRHGVHIELVRVPWAERGWFEALLWLGRQASGWKRHYVVVQYTALGWSRRGFPLGLLPVLALLRFTHVSFGVVFHDAAAYPGRRCVDRLRRAIQQFVMKKIAAKADRVILPANSENLTWLTPERSNVAFMPVGSNVPAPSDQTNDTAPFNGQDRLRTIAVFGITEGKDRRDKEIASIREVTLAVARRISGVRLCVFGRGVKEAEAQLRQSLHETGIELSVFGVLPAEEAGEMLSRADVQIDVRAHISSRRGSVVAGIVCNTPVVGFESSETDSIIRQAGVVLIAPGDIGAMTAAVTHILSDDSFQEELRLRNRVASRNYFSWDAISDQLVRTLQPTLNMGDDARTERRYRILLVCTHPVQYATPVFRQMALDPRLDILVAYCSLQGAEAGLDEEFGHEVEWDIPLLDGYPWIQVKNRSPRPGLGRFFGLINLGLWTIVHRGRYDAVLLFTGYRYSSFWIAVLAAKLNDTAVLFGTDATSIQPRVRTWWKPLIKRFVLSQIYRFADGKWAASAAGKEYLKSLKVPEEHIGIAPLVVDNDWWTARAGEVDRPAVRRSWGVPETGLIILFCAKLQPWKRPQDLLRAFARAGVPGGYLFFAGTGPLAGALAAEAKHLGIADRVRFVGFYNQTNLPSVYCSADLFVLPSEYDPCPAVVCEAMLCGLPVILSDAVRGRFELVEPGRTGFIFRCGDVEDLARLLRDATADPVRLGHMGAVARDAMKNCSPHTNVRDVVRLLDQVFRMRSTVGRKNRLSTNEAIDSRPKVSR